jgi:hypothetical protein
VKYLKGVFDNVRDRTHNDSAIRRDIPGYAVSATEKAERSEGGLSVKPVAVGKANKSTENEHGQGDSLLLQCPLATR